MKRKFNKKLLTFGILGVFALALVTAGLLTYYGQIQQHVNVEQAVTLTGGNCGSNTCSEDAEIMHSGDTIVSDVYTLTNNADTSREVGLTTSYDPTIESGEIVTTYVEYFDDAGAMGYVAPTDCNVNVISTDNLQSAIDNANVGSVVCVGPGTYNKNVVIDKDITLASTAGPDTTIIDAENSGSGIVVNDKTVTIEGFTIQNYDGQSAEGILVNGGNVVVRYNVIQASTTPNPTYSIDSIYTKNEATVTVDHNTLKNNKFGPNAYKDSINDWSTSAGIAVHEGDTVTATNNLFDNNDFGIQVKSTDNSAETVTAHHNNFWTSNGMDFFYEKRSSGTSATPFDATNNWWGTDGIDIAAGNSSGFIDVNDYINADWMTKIDFTLTSEEVDRFAIVNDFMTTGFDGVITTKVLPVVE